MKSRPAALRHPAGGMTSDGHDHTAGQHGNEPTRRAHHRTVSLRAWKELEDGVNWARRAIGAMALIFVIAKIAEALRT